MPRPVLLWCAVGMGVARALAAEPVNQVVLDLAASAEHPRNSEGAFAILRSGRIIFCYSQFSRGTSDFSPSGIAEIDSDDQGRTWGRPHVLFSLSGDAQEMSVSLLRLASGKLAMFSLIKHGKLECRPYIRVSADDGGHWTEPRPLSSAPGYFVLNNDRVIQTSTGRLIAPVAYHRTLPSVHAGDSATDLRGVALWYYSDDEGASWAESRTWWTLPIASGTGMQEPGVVQLDDGSLLSWARTDLGCQYECRSADGGLTWSPPRPTELRSPASPAGIKRIPGASTLLGVLNDFSGQFPFIPSPSTYRGRTPWVAELSTDGGHTWARRKLLESDPQRDFCYPALAFSGDTLLLAYMAIDRAHGRTSSLVIRRISLPWLCAPEDPVAVRSRAVLHGIFDQEESWVKIHAAEALMAGGEAISIRDQFLRMVPTVNSLPYRVGVWRVLAETSPTAAERASCVAAVEKIYGNPASPDRSQAIETLCKLRCSLGGEILDEVRQEAAQPPGQLKPVSLQPLALWSLQLSGDPGALERLCALLRSPAVSLRVDAAYALRLLRTQEPSALRALAAAASAEPPGTAAYPYMLSAAFALRADPSRQTLWRAGLERLVQEGTMDARFEAFQGLMADVALDDLPRYEHLLDGPGHDTQVAAACTILYVHARL